MPESHGSGTAETTAPSGWILGLIAIAVLVAGFAAGFWLYALLAVAIVGVPIYVRYFAPKGSEASESGLQRLRKRGS
jgi:hypothetical protein